MTIDLENYVPEPNTGCWLWLGGVTHYGYPTNNLHRIVYCRKHPGIEKIINRYIIYVKLKYALIQTISS